MMNAIARILGIALLAAAGSAPANEGGATLEPAPAHRLDVESLQRGAGHFVNYCLNCHSAQYMRYNRLTSLGLDRATDQGQPDVRHRQDRLADDFRR